MPDHEDSLGGDTFSGEEQQDAAEQSLGDGATMGGDTAAHSLGDQSTFGDANVDDELFVDGMELVDLSTRYTEEGVLGKGGFGEVVVATDTRLGRKVAIKRIQGKAARSKTAVQRFLTEAKSIATLSHNNIVQIYDYGRSTDGPFLIMECVQGGSLLDLCRKGPIELDKAVKIFSQVCDGLAKAHAIGIIHRDIKPANILMTEDGVPKLTDFGLAKDDTADAGMTMEGAVIGTLDFMPPEQRQGAEFTDHRSDIWSLAATFYQMFTGKSPKVINIALLPPNLQPVVAKALEESKEERFQSVLEMKKAFLQAATAGFNASRDLGEGECPSCGTTNPSDRKFCRNADCAASLEVDCLACKTAMPMWEAVCGDCGTKQGPLVEEAKEVLQRKHDEAEAFLNELKFEDALKSASTISGENDLRLQQFAAWHEEFSQRLVDTRKTEHERLEELLEEAKTHEENDDYKAARGSLSKVDKRLEDHELENLGSAKSIRARITAALARIEKLSTANKTIKEQAVAFLEWFEFDKAIEAARAIETDDHPHLKEYDAWVDEFGEEVQSKRHVAYKQLEEQLSQALEYEENFDYEAGLQTLTQVAPSLKQTTVSGNEDTADVLTERLTTKKSRLKELEGIVRERVTKREITGLLPTVNELLTLKPDRPEVQKLKEQLEKRDADLLEARDAAINKATQQLGEQHYAEAVATLNTVSEEVWNEELEDLRAKASDLLKQLNTLCDRITSAVAADQLKGLLPVVEECLTLKADQDDFVKLKEQLEKRDADLLEVRDAAVKQATQQLGDQQYAEAVATLNTVSAEVSNEQLEDLKAKANDLLNQLNNLRNRITTAVNGNQLKDLLPAIEECLTLKADQDDLVKLKQDLIDREVQMDARNQQIISQAQQHMQQLQFDAVVQTLDTIAPEYRTLTTTGLSIRAHQLSEQRQGVLSAVSAALSNKDYRVAIKNISDYLGEIANADLQDPQLQQMLAEVEGKESASIRNKALVKFGIPAACIVVVLIIGGVIKINLDSRAIETAIAYLDWETVLELDPDNAEGLRLKAAAEKSVAAEKAAAEQAAAEKVTAEKAAAEKAAAEKVAAEKVAAEKAAAKKVAAIAAALAKEDWKVVLALDPDNNEGLRLKAAAAEKAVADALAKEDWKVVLALDPDNNEGLRLKAAAAAKAVSEKAAILAGDPLTNTVGMTFNKISAGTFMMGFAIDKLIATEEGPVVRQLAKQREVRISKEFYIQTTEVTRGQWKAVMDTEPWKGRSRLKGANFPANHTSRNDVIEYCRKLSYKEDNRYRLPTEAEWEYACRAGTKTTWSFGNDFNDHGDYVWSQPNAGSAGAHEVGLKKPNAFGLYDMHGNVWEWCHGANVLRGGAWHSNGSVTSSAYRSGNDPDLRRYDHGFRLVRELD